MSSRFTRHVTSGARVAVVAHLHYEDLWPALREQFGNIQLPYDLYATYSGTHPRFVDATLRPHCKVAVRVQNRGRDMAPFLYMLRRERLWAYDAILKIHTKRSAHRADGDMWRSALWHGVLTSPDSVTRTVLALMRHGGPSLMAPADSLSPLRVEDPNGRELQGLMSRLGIEQHGPLTFPKGSMYWLTGQLAREVAFLPLKTRDFPPEAGQQDETLAHVLERLIGVLAIRVGGGLGTVPQVNISNNTSRQG